MTLLIDFSQIIISESISYHSQTRESISIDLLRHISLNNILNLKNKLRRYSNEIILCLDGRNYWRKSWFPYYKQNRKKDHQESSFDWNEFYVSFNQIKSEFKEHLPYRVLEVENAEADDIIAVLCKLLCPHKEICIVSTDKDLIQIQTSICTHARQYSPFHKKFLESDHNDYSIFQHIVRGDASDGIPNILSDDDVYITEKRSKPIRATTVIEWSRFGIDHPEEFCRSAVELERFIRNRTLIDLTAIPEDTVNKIIVAYSECKPSSKSMFEYLIHYRLAKLLSRVNEFEIANQIQGKGK